MRAVFADGSHVRRVHAAHAEHRRWISESRRLHSGKRIDKRLCHFRKLQFEVIFLRRNKRLRRGLRPNGLAQPPSKFRYIFSFNRQSGGLRMPAEANEQVTACAHCIMDVHAGNRPRRTDADIAVLREQHRRPFVFFHQPGSCQPDDAGIPSLAADDNGAFVHKINLLPRHLVRLLENVNLQLPAADVILIQFFGNLPRRVHSPCRQKLNAARGQRQPPACVDSRRHAERNVGRCDLLRVNPGGFHQRNQPRPLRSRHRRQPVGHNDAVFIHQRHDIRNRRQRGELPKRLNRFRSADCLNQLKRNARATQPTKRVIAQQRIEHCLAFGHLRPELVVIRHNHAHPQFLRPRDLRRARNTAIYGNQQFGMCRNLFDRRDIQAISFAVSVRNIKIDLCALFAQIGQKNGRGGDAIHVVIAENRDLLMLLDGVADDGDRLPHILHQHRVMQILALRMQIALDFFRRVNLPIQQQLKQPIGQSKRGKLRRNLPLFLIFRYQSKHAEAPFLPRGLAINANSRSSPNQRVDPLIWRADSPC